MIALRFFASICIILSILFIPAGIKICRAQNIGQQDYSGVYEGTYYNHTVSLTVGPEGDITGRWEIHFEASKNVFEFTGKIVDGDSFVDVVETHTMYLKNSETGQDVDRVRVYENTLPVYVSSGRMNVLSVELENKAFIYDPLSQLPNNLLLAPPGGHDGLQLHGMQSRPVVSAASEHEGVGERGSLRVVPSGWMVMNTGVCRKCRPRAKSGLMNMAGKILQTLLITGLRFKINVITWMNAIKTCCANKKN